MNPYILPGLVLITKNGKLPRRYINSDPEKEKAKTAEWRDPNEILKLVAHISEFTVEDLLKKGRTRRKILCRKYLFYFLFKNSWMSKSEIGALAEQDHTTVIHAINSLMNLAETDENVKAEIEYMADKIKDLKLKK